LTNTISLDNLEIDVPRMRRADGRDLDGVSRKLNGKVMVVVWDNGSA